MRLYNHLHQSAVTHEGKVALIIDGFRYEYTEVDKSVIDIAETLKEQGISKDSRICTILENSKEFVFCIYASSYLNAHCALLNPEFSIHQLEEYIEYARIDMVLTYGDIGKKLSGFLLKNGIGLIKVENGAIYTILPVKTSHKHDLMTQPSLIQTSSGTTGNPKMAYREECLLESDLNTIVESFKYTMNDTIYCAVPIYHGYGLTMALLSGLLVGATVVIDKWFMVNRFISMARKQMPSVVIGAPNTYELLLSKANELEWQQPRYLFSSGTALSKTLALLFYETTCRWINQMYGMMEASTITANFNPTYENCNSVGKPAFGVDIRIEKRNGESFVSIKSNAISEMYITQIGDVHIQKESNWFMNGDRGYLDEDGNLFILGRGATAEVVE